MVTCIFSEEFGRMNLGSFPRVQLDGGYISSPPSAAAPFNYSPTAQPWQYPQSVRQDGMMEGPRFQQKNAAASSGPAGSRKRPRFLTVEIPTGITDDTTADAYQRTMTPGDSPQTPRTPWRWESGMMQ